MNDQQPTTVVRKRQQIANANRTMFIWVALASVVVGIAAVAILFLGQKALFNERVLAEKGKTASTLQKNLKAIDSLKDEVRLMNTNDALRSVATSGEAQPIQVVLDALPAEANSSALGASLLKIIREDTRIRDEAFRVDPVAGVEAGEDAGVQDASDSDEPNQINFSFAVSANANDVNALKELLQRLERSIRAIDVSALTIEGQGSRVVMTVEGRAYYEPAKTVELKEKTIKPKG